jgi:phytoene dehydrogenase-like protein
MERLDAVVVGGGLGGLTCAYCLAQEGLQVVVLERGNHPGSCHVACPLGALQWSYPRGGFGVQYRYG